MEQTKKKQYKINIASSRNYIHISDKYTENDGGCFMIIYLTNEEYEKIKNIKGLHLITKRRSMYQPAEYILDCIYRELPWLFEY